MNLLGLAVVVRLLCPSKAEMESGEPSLSSSSSSIVVACGLLVVVFEGIYLFCTADYVIV